MVDELETHVQLYRLAFVDEAFATQRQADDLHHLAGVLQGSVERHPVPALDHLRPARPQPQNEATLRQHVQGAGALRQQCRRARKDVQDSRPDLDALCPHGQRRHDADGVVRVGFGDEDRLVTQLLGGLDVLDHLVEGNIRIGELDRELHGGSPPEPT